MRVWNLSSRTAGAALLALVGAGVACAAPAKASGNPKHSLLDTQPSVWAAKPDAAAFEALENQHLARAQRAIDAIHALKGAHTVANTVAPYDRAVREINAALYLSSDMEAVHPDAAFRDRATAMTRKVSALQTTLSLDPVVYHALAAVRTDGLDAPTRHYLERQALEFKLAGVDKDEATRTRLKKLNDELTEEQSSFQRNINDDHRSVSVADRSELEGLPADFIEHHPADEKGEIRLSTDYPDYIPVMSYARSDALRRRLHLAFENRAYPANREVLERMLTTRYQIAQLLGYDSWADYNAADKMIGRGAKIGEFIAQLESVARPDAEREYQMLLAQKQKRHPGATLIERDERAFYEEQVRRTEYTFDSQSVRPYFPYARVRQGILDTAASLFHLTFEQDTAAPAWAPDVETWVVYDQGQPIGRFYLDMHPRAGKFTHAEMAPVLDGVRGEQLPEAILICNFPSPTPSDPGLMTHEEVTTFFHEFGHLMHWILGGRQRWAGISGISMESDFIEAPSQMLEEWMQSPQVLAKFAHHYQTGEPIPASLVQQMNRAKAFGRGGWVSMQNAYTAISYDVYRSPPQGIDVDAITRDDLLRYSRVAPLEGTHSWAAFGHLAGYSSAYYTYLWDKVIAEDFFGEFDPSNLLSSEVSMRYRRSVLEPGGSVPAEELVRGFLGRAQRIEALKRWMDVEFTPRTD